MTQHDPHEMQIAAWLRSMPPRPVPSPTSVTRARLAARRQWKQVLSKRRQARVSLFPALATAAATVAALSLFWFGLRDRPEASAATAFGQVEHLAGGVRVATSGEPERPLLDGSALVTGMSLATDDGRFAVAVPNGLSLRVNRHSRLRLEDPGQVTLLAGSVYVDSGRIAGSRHLRIVSPAGTIEHVGTQYLVTVSGDMTRIAVREGMLRLDAAAGGRTGAATLISQGRQVEIRPGQAPVWESVTPHDARWNWAAAAAPVLDIEGRSVSAFLDWICREQGWTWDSRATLQRAELDAILLHGSIEGLAADEALALVAAVAEVGIELDEPTGTVMVGPAATARKQP